MTPPQLESARLVLEPLRVEHAGEMALVLDDPRLHAFTGGEPLGEDGLRDRYRRQVLGGPADRRQEWVSWIVRMRGERAVGYVQATVEPEADGVVAELAWVVGVDHQGHGYAREGAQIAADWLRTRGGVTLQAHVHPGHGASQAVARSLGLIRTGAVVDGEDRWEG